MDISLKVRPPNILLYSSESLGELVYQLHAKWDGRFRAYRLPFSPESLIAIKRVLPDILVSEGQEFIDEMKVRLKNIHHGRNSFDTHSVHISDTKLTPFEHQKKGLAYLDLFDGAALFADCGVGKTGMTLWDIELKYKKKQLKPSSVLVVGKLMTLHSGWHKDTEEFTHLTSEVLWEPSKTKIEKGEKEHVTDHGPKPKGKSKVVNKTEYFHRDGSSAILASARHFNPGKHVARQRSWKQVGDVKYGPEVLVTITRRNIRAENISRKISTHDASIHIINHEGLVRFEEELTNRSYDLIVIDESTAIKNPQSKMFRALLRISQNTRYRRVLSGTPSPQGPQDLWSQFYFLDLGLTLGPVYQEYIDRYFDVVTFGSGQTFAGTKINIRAHGKRGQIGTLEYVRQQLNKRVFRCKLRDCVDIPSISISTLDVFMTDKQTKHYESMKEEFIAEIADEQIEVTTDLAKMGKLRQITSGFIINKEKTVIRLSERNPKLDVLLSFLEEIDPQEKIVIFAVFRCEIEMLLETFGDQAVAIYGGVTDVKKIEAQARFINDPKTKYIICQPQSAAYGVNGLTVARYLIFYSIDYRADTNYQAIKRVERTGQKRSIVVRYLLAKNTIDTAIYKAIQTKTGVQQRTVDTSILEELRR